MSQNFTLSRENYGSHLETAAPPGDEWIQTFWLFVLWQVTTLWLDPCALLELSYLNAGSDQRAGWGHSRKRILCQPFVVGWLHFLCWMARWRMHHGHTRSQMTLLPSVRRRETVLWLRRDAHADRSWTSLSPWALASLCLWSWPSRFFRVMGRALLNQGDSS